jgi:hypothetical protein
VKARKLSGSVYAAARFKTCTCTQRHFDSIPFEVLNTNQ